MDRLPMWRMMSISTATTCTRYMYGLAVTSFLWPNHRNIMRFFCRTLPRDRKGKYMEMGPGHGFFFMTAIEESSYDEFEGIDISETSVSQTRRIIDFYGMAKGVKAQIIQRDFLDGGIPPASCDAVVMGEVLEHVERPDIFMKRVAEVTKKDAWIFISTCCNAPAIDHIFLFRSAARGGKAVCGYRADSEGNLRICPARVRRCRNVTAGLPSYLVSCSAGSAQQHRRLATSLFELGSSGSDAGDAA